MPGYAEARTTSAPTACVVAVVLAVLGAVPAPAAAQRRDPGAVLEGCALCHGELELLRQRVATLERARELLVLPGELAHSAHDTMSCGDCHSGFDRFPHPLPDPGSGIAGAVSTDSCISCHTDQQDGWSGSIHEREDEGAECTECHGVHDVLTPDDSREGPGLRRMNNACVECHDAAELPPLDPHADAVPCWSCHAPHGTQATDDGTSRVAPPHQVATCGNCHEEVADSASADIHGTRLRESGVGTLAMLEHEGSEAPPACTSCHGSHGMLATSDPDFGQTLVERCSACHEHYAETFDETYHGQATALGSEAVATCQDCHSAHAVRPAADPRSTVSDERLVETCRTCHPAATPSFAAFEPHADPHDRERYPHVYWVYTLMTGLLIGVFAFFGTHTALWLLRLGRNGRERKDEGG